MRGSKNKWIAISCSVLLIICFFLPWVQWSTMPVAGYDLPAGRFFSVSEKKFGLANPFPALSPLFNLFWIVPVAALFIIVLAITRKKTGAVASVTGLSALSLVTVFILFTQTLTDLGVSSSVTGALRPGLYATVVAAFGVILTGIERRWLLKILLLITGPLAVWSGFYFISKRVESDAFDNTASVKTVYKVNGPDLIREFVANDTAANNKYREKIIEVNGRATGTEHLNDSTLNVKIEDAAGSYIIFSFVGDVAKEARNIKAGDSISVKGSCSGSIYSAILETEVISFKRCAFNKIN